MAAFSLSWQAGIAEIYGKPLSNFAQLLAEGGGDRLVHARFELLNGGRQFCCLDGLASRYSKSGLPQQNCPFIWLCRSEEQADIWQPAASLSQLELHNGIRFPTAAILEVGRSDTLHSAFSWIS